MQDIIANAIDTYRTQEQMQMPEVEQIEEEESSSSSSASSSLSSEEELSQEMMSLDVGDIAEIAKI